MDKLYSLIAFAESPRQGYDAIHNSATRLTGKRPTQMTLGEIKAWIAATPGQHHAIGRFQIIPSTLVNLQRRLSLGDGALFNRATQNRMASLLLSDAEYQGFVSGRVSRSQFMDNLARIWAGLPKANGRSHYHGYAGNRATITRAFFERQMALIYPAGQSRNLAAETAHSDRSERARNRGRWTSVSAGALRGADR